MIHSIHGGGNYLTVANGYPNTPYVSIDQNNPVSGMIRLNGSNLEVFNGAGWLALSTTSASINLTDAAIDALNWAQKKMQEETKIRELAANSPTVADALARYELAQEQLKMVLTLTNEA